MFADLASILSTLNITITPFQLELKFEDPQLGQIFSVVKNLQFLQAKTFFIKSLLFTPL